MDIIDCFASESLPDGVLTVYDTDPNKRVWFANHLCGKVTIESRKIAANNQATIPMIPRKIFPHSLQNDVACELLLQAVRWFPLVQNLLEVKMTATELFGRRDLLLSSLLTHKDHRFIPRGIALAVIDPVYLGRCAYNLAGVGLCLLNRKGVLAFRYREFPEQRALYATPFDGVLDDVVLHPSTDPEG